MKCVKKLSISHWNGMSILLLTFLEYRNHKTEKKNSSDTLLKD